jgi:hypothetical protein
MTRTQDAMACAVEERGVRRLGRRGPSAAWRLVAMNAFLAPSARTTRFWRRRGISGSRAAAGQLRPRPSATPAGSRLPMSAAAAVALRHPRQALSTGGS